MLSPEQKAELAEQGYTIVRKLVHPTICAAARAMMVAKTRNFSATAYL